MSLRKQFPNIPQAVVNEIEDLTSQGESLVSACHAIVKRYGLKPPKENDISCRDGYRYLKPIGYDTEKFVAYINQELSIMKSYFPLNFKIKFNNIFIAAINTGNILLADELLNDDWLDLSTVFSKPLADSTRIDHFNENKIITAKRLLKYKNSIPNTDLNAAFKIVIEQSNTDMLKYLINHHAEITMRDNKLTSSQKSKLLSVADKIGNDQITQPLHEAFESTLDYGDLLENQGLAAATGAIANNFLGWLHDKTEISIGTKRKRTDTNLETNHQNNGCHSDNDNLGRTQARLQTSK